MANDNTIHAGTEHAGTGGMPRRQLLKLATTAGAMGWLSGTTFLSNAAHAAAADQEVLSGSHWGAFHAKVENGRFVSLRPWDKDPHPSPQIAGVQDIVYSPSRIRYPMVRRAYLEHGPGASPETRGTGDFVRVSWDKALDLVAEQIKQNEAIGPWSIFAGTYGWRSCGKFGNPQVMLQRMLNLSGGFVNSMRDYSKGAIEGMMPYVMGTIEGEGPQTAYDTVVESTELLVFWSCDPLKNNQISAAIPDHKAWAWMEALKASGKKAIFIDPVRTEACKQLGAEWIPIRPHTDVALMLGIAHTLFTEKLHDAKFLANYATGFDRFADYLTGKPDGVPKTAEWAADICDVPPDRIRDLAHRLVKGRTMLAAGWAMQRQQYGEQPHWALITLAAMLGQMGLPGAGVGFRYHIDGGGAPAAAAPVMSGMSPGQRKAGVAWPADKGVPVIPCARIVDMLLNPGGTFESDGKKQTYPAVKLVYWVGGNPFSHHQDRNRMVAAWRKLDTFVVQDFVWTASARFADIVLPATTTCERNDIERVGPASGVAIVAMKKIIDPVFEARNDYDIFTELARRLGVEQAFTTGKTEMDWIGSIYSGALDQAQARHIPMPEFDDFWNGSGVVEFEVPPAAHKYVRLADFRSDPLLNPLPTPSGLIEIYSRTIEKMSYDDCPPHPTWLEPSERLGRAGAKYPLHVSSSHSPFRLHSQLCGTVLREQYAVAGREPCWLNPADATKRGIKAGDVLRVFNDRGQCLAGAVVTEDIRPGVIQLHEGAWYDPEEPGKPDTLCKFGDPNVLTQDIGTSRLSQSTSANTVLAEVEKFTGVLPAVTVFTAPASAV